MIVEKVFGSMDPRNELVYWLTFIETNEVDESIKDGVRFVLSQSLI
jgi:hypothetical protein